MLLKRYAIPILLAISVIFGFLLRWYLMPDAIFFGPEQGRDFLAAREIIYHRNFTLIGPKTDYDGVFHGPLYYYLLAIPVRLSQGDPAMIALLMILIQAAAIIPIYYLGLSLSHNQRVGIIASLLYSVSIGLIVWSRWLSNPALVIPLTVICLLAISKFIQGQKYWLMVAVITAGFMGQMEFIQYLILPIFFLLIFLRYRPQFKQAGWPWVLVCLAIGVSIGFGSYILFDLRHDWLTLHSLTRAFYSGHGSNLSFYEAWSQVWLVLNSWFSQHIGLMPSGLTPILIFILIGYLCLKFLQGDRQQEILLWWIISPLILLLIFQRGALDQLLVMIGPAVILTLALIIQAVWNRYGVIWGILLTTVILVINLHNLQSNLPNNHQVFFQSSQPNVKLSDQLAVIDYIYQDAGDRTFGYESFTVPYFWRDHWDYLFWYRGQDQHQGKFPSGLNSDFYYVIEQTDGGDKYLRQMWVSDIKRDTGQLIGTRTIGVFNIMKFVPK